MVRLPRLLYTLFNKVLHFDYVLIVFVEFFVLLRRLSLSEGIALE